MTPDSCGVIVVLGDNRVELLFGILGGGGKISGNVEQDCDLLGGFNGDGD